MSKLEEKILEGLKTIGYNGPLSQKPQFSLAVEGGQKNVEFTKLVNFLTNEIRILLGIDEEVNAIPSPEDHVAFVMEITSFLNELNCPYKVLTHGHVSDRLQVVSDRFLLLDYLITELMGARILQDKRPGKKIELKLQETPEGKDMRMILQTLRFPKPPANISVSTLFQKLGPTIPIVVGKAGTDIIGNGIFNGFLSEKQWEVLSGVQTDLSNEYKIRREMLLTRLDVTIQSFQWSERTKGKDDLFEKIYHDKRVQLKVEPDVDLSDLLAARTDLAIIEKTSSSSVRKNTKSKLNKVIIGVVPDRGGRTSEIAPPPPEMPSWQQRSTGPAGGRGGGNFNRGGGNNYQRGGGSSYTRGGGGQNYSSNNSFSGGNSYGNTNHQSNQSSGGYNSNRSFDSSGSYSTPGTGYSNRSYENDRGRGSSGGGYDNRSSGGYDNRGGSVGYDAPRRDSGGSYSSQDFQQTKRAKTYDNFQANKTTYADQYVQESQHNQQYYSRGNHGSNRGGDRGSRGGGRSNYQRGGYR